MDLNSVWGTSVFLSSILAVYFVPGQVDVTGRGARHRAACRNMPGHGPEANRRTSRLVIFSGDIFVCLEAVSKPSDESICSFVYKAKNNHNRVLKWAPVNYSGTSRLGRGFQGCLLPLADFWIFQNVIAVSTCNHPVPGYQLPGGTIVKPEQGS